jgi:hypothetical protein
MTSESGLSADNTMQIHNCAENTVEPPPKMEEFENAINAI